MVSVRLGAAATFGLAVALALALLAPPATGVEFTAEDMESDASMWALYERWSAHFEVARDAGDKLRRFGNFKATARRVYAAHPGDRHYVLGLNIFADMDDYERVPSLDNLKLMSAVSHRPVVAAIDQSFVDYPGGIYRGPCGHTGNHEMLLVGYGSTGTTFDDVDFWILKNSHGEGWGEKGYMRLLRDGDSDLGTCGILMDASYPTLDGDYY